MFFTEDAPAALPPNRPKKLVWVTPSTRKKSNQGEQHADDDVHLVHREREFIVNFPWGLQSPCCRCPAGAFALLKIGLLRLQFSLLAGKFCLAGGQCGPRGVQLGLGIRGGLCQRKSSPVRQDVFLMIPQKMWTKKAPAVQRLRVQRENDERLLLSQILVDINGNSRW